MRIKVNHLVNLQDARYSAGYFADLLCFALERGSLYKITERDILEMSEWITDVPCVVQFGMDAELFAEQAEAWHSKGLLLELDAMAEVPASALSQLSTGLRLQLSAATLHHLANGALHERLDEAIYMELLLNPDVMPTKPEQAQDFVGGIRRHLQPSTPIFLQADGHSLAALHTFVPVIDGLSFGSKLTNDFTAMDYDAFEALLDTYRPDGPHTEG